MGSHHEARGTKAPTVDAVVLAAGEASRMGRPKHLLRVQGVPMLARVVETLRRSRVRTTVGVLRPGDRDGRKLLDRLGVPAVEAQDCGEGRAASIRAGLQALAPDAEAVLFALADQPLLEPDDFNALIERFGRGDAGIVHATYGGKRGSPVLFGQVYRSELLALQGEEGGREIVRRHMDDAAGVPLPPEHGRDIDRPEDLERVR